MMFNFFKKGSSEKSESTLHIPFFCYSTREIKAICDIASETQKAITEYNNSLLTKLKVEQKKLRSKIEKYKSEEFVPRLTTRHGSNGDFLDIDQDQTREGTDNKTLSIPVDTIRGIECAYYGNIIEMSESPNLEIWVKSRRRFLRLMYNTNENEYVRRLLEPQRCKLNDILVPKDKLLLEECNGDVVSHISWNLEDFINPFIDIIIHDKLPRATPSEIYIKTNYGRYFSIFYDSYDESDLVASLNIFVP